VSLNWCIRKDEVSMNDLIQKNNNFKYCLLLASVGKLQKFKRLP